MWFMCSCMISQNIACGNYCLLTISEFSNHCGLSCVLTILHVLIMMRACMQPLYSGFGMLWCLCMKHLYISWLEATNSCDWPNEYFAILELVTARWLEAWRAHVYALVNEQLLLLLLLENNSCALNFVCARWYTMSTSAGQKDGIMNVFSLYSSCIFVLNVEFGTAAAAATTPPATSPARKNGAAKPQRFCSPSVMKNMKERLVRAGVSRIGRYWMTPSLALEVDFSSALQLEKFVNNLEQGGLIKQLSDSAAPPSSDRTPSPSSVPLQMSLYFIRPSQEQEEVVMELVTSANVSRCVSIWRKRVRFNMGALLNWYKQTEQSRVSGEWVCVCARCPHWES